ncbi:MAG: MltA domain-containing protein [Sphingomonadales bacterium]|jgi:membrane-bound lytic murein transglycosylase A
MARPGPKRRAARGFAPLVGLSILLALAALFIALTLPRDETPHYRTLSWSQLKGWKNHNFSGAFKAYQKSCEALVTRKDTDPMPIGPFDAKARDWKQACDAVLNSGAPFKAAIERNYKPIAIKVLGRWAGHFTGYYVPLLKGSLTPSPDYPIPLYRRPTDLIDVDLGLFREALKGQRVSGRLSGRKLIPHADRSEIEAGALEGQGLELVWVSSAIDAFFLHIQGSGYIELDTGERIKVGYDGQNGHPYYAIGRSLIEAEEIAPEEMSLQAIAAWMQDNSDRAEALMLENKSYVFFRILEGNGVLGAQGVELTPMRSMAIDRRLIPYGAPLWIETQLSKGQDFRQFMMAQDTGGAIIGPGRGDIFFGLGPEALALAGPMNAEGRMVILLPRSALEAKAQNG